MKDCIECGLKERRRNSYLCKECFQKKLRDNPELKRAAEVKVESPHASWF